MKATKQLRNQADKLNGLIVSENLYHKTKGRCINAHVVDGVLVVESLNSGEIIPFVDADFKNGYGNSVFF